MRKILYFNITYNCNSNCSFCFSNSTGKHTRELEMENIVACLDRIGVEREDFIILNGGEPALHSRFYEIVETLSRRYPSTVKVYTNGSVLDVSRLRGTERIIFVIPVHGDSRMHYEITGVLGLYEKTMEHVRLLEQEDIAYSIKFIMNRRLLNSFYDIKHFLTVNGFRPKEVVLARLNETDKARLNGVDMPVRQEIISWLRVQKKNLVGEYPLKYLDIPFCYLDMEEEETIYEEEEPIFYFNDINHRMEKRSYYKDVMIGGHCGKCRFCEQCRKLKRSYLTLTSDRQGWKMEAE